MSLLIEPLPALAGTGAKLVQRTRLPRSIGLALGGLCVGAALLQRSAPWWLLSALAVHSLLWPQIAWWWGRRCAQAREAEHRNLLVDSLLGGFWVAAMGFNPPPATLILAMLTMNNVAIGGRWLFARGLLAQAAGVGLGVALLGVHWEPLATLPTVLASLPFMVAYPLVIGATAYRLSMKLSRQKAALAQSERLHRGTLDAIDAGIVLYDSEDRLVLCNDAFRSLYAPIASMLVPGRRFEDALRAAVAQQLIPAAIGWEEAWIQERLREHARPGAPALRELPGDRWIRIVEQRLPDGGLLAFSTDVTELVRKQRELQVAQAEAERARGRLEDAIEALPDGFALFDDEDRLVVFNQRYCELYVDSAPVIRRGATFESLLRYGLEHGQYAEALGRESEWLAERLRQHRAGQMLLQELPGNRWLRIHERRTREGGLAGVRIDVTPLVRREQELKRLNAQLDASTAALREANTRLEHLSDTDALTGVANRRGFDRRLHEEWERAQRHGTTLALLMIDVDHFKRFNDAHGHVAGDQCLRAVAGTLARCALRPGDLVARYGGEEFTLLLPHTDAAQASLLAQRCIDALDARALAHGASPVAAQVTISIGVAAARPAGPLESPDSLVREADAALYQAKKRGRHRWEQAA